MVTEGQRPRRLIGATLPTSQPLTRRWLDYPADALAANISGTGIPSRAGISSNSPFRHTTFMFAGNRFTASPRAGTPDWTTACA